jgi:hypothetical protein
LFRVSSPFLCYLLQGVKHVCISMREWHNATFFDTIIQEKKKESDNRVSKHWDWFIIWTVLRRGKLNFR